MGLDDFDVRFAVGERDGFAGEDAEARDAVGHLFQGLVEGTGADETGCAGEDEVHGWLVVPF